MTRRHLSTYFSFLLGGGYNINSHWHLLTLKLRRDILNFTTDVSQKWGFADSPLPPLSAKIRNRLTPLTLLVRNNIWMHSILFLKKITFEQIGPLGRFCLVVANSVRFCCCHLFMSISQGSKGGPRGAKTSPTAASVPSKNLPSLPLSVSPPLPKL